MEWCKGLICWVKREVGEGVVRLCLTRSKNQGTFYYNVLGLEVEWSKGIWAKGLLVWAGVSGILFGLDWFLLILWSVWFCN